MPPGPDTGLAIFRTSVARFAIVRIPPLAMAVSAAPGTGPQCPAGMALAAGEGVPVAGRPDRGKRPASGVRMAATEPGGGGRPASGKRTMGQHSDEATLGRGGKRTGRQTDGAANGRGGKRTGRQTDGAANGRGGKRTGRQTDGAANGRGGKRTGRQTDGAANGRGGKRTGRQTDGAANGRGGKRTGSGGRRFPPSAPDRGVGPGPAVRSACRR